MNKETCWHCKREFIYDDPKYRDVDCPHCGVMNSFYDPDIFVDTESEVIEVSPKQNDPGIKSSKERISLEFDCKRCQDELTGPVPKWYCSVCKKTKGEEMINYGDEKYQGKILFMPPVGQTIELDIVELNEVKSDNPKMNFRDKVPVTQGGEQVVDDDNEPVFKEKDLGYHVEAKLRNGKTLVINSLAQLNQVFKKFNIQDGDKVNIVHKAKGEWEVTKL